MKLWGGENLDNQIEDFTVGNDYVLDKKLIYYDCQASIVHATMLEKLGILTSNELGKISDVLKEIMQLNSKGEFQISPQQEDCHTAIEEYLTEKLGDAGKKIHTARSRNDQVITALRLFEKHELLEIISGIKELVKAFKDLSAKYAGIKMPGYTHMRKAMPSSFGLWSGAFIDSMEDNIKIISNTLSLIDVSPLGTGAGYGIPINLDRKLTAEMLGFAKVQENPIYVQNSRLKFETLILSSLSHVMMDINKIASDIILFSMPEFGYFVLTDNLCTGSSIMPHKKNPDVLELLRANYHVITSKLMLIMGLGSNLISGYNRDHQLGKEAIMSSMETVEKSVAMMVKVINNLEVNEEKCSNAMTEELFSAEKTLKQALKGVPFRDSYQNIAGEYKKQ